jgi:hypothetical protein
MKLKEVGGESHSGVEAGDVSGAVHVRRSDCLIPQKCVSYLSSVSDVFSPLIFSTDSDSNYRIKCWPATVS